MAWRSGVRARGRTPCAGSSHFLVRGADDAAAAPADAKVSVGGKVLREYSYATGTPIAATPQV